MTPLHPAGVIARYIVLGAGLGIVGGLVWVFTAPRVEVRADAVPVQSYPEQFAAADLTLGVVLVVAGLVLGVVAARRLGRTGFDGGWAQIAGVIAGALACGGVARVVGWWLAGRAMNGADLPLTLSADGVLLLGVVSGLLVIILAAAFARDPQTDT